MSLAVGNIPNPPIDKLLRHWLLDVAVEFPRNLCLLFPFVDGEALNAKTIHGHQPKSYSRALLDMFEEGLIRFSSDVQGDDVQASVGVARVLERFLGLSKDDSQLRRGGRFLPAYQRCHIKELQVYFELTPEGGQAWEKIARPNWDHCFTQSTGNADCELVSQNRDLLMAVLGWFREADGGLVDLDSVEIQKLNDCPILYWKHLPSVFRVKFIFEKSDARWSGDGPTWSREPKWFQEWWTSATSWYRKPWELPTWPSE